MNPKSEFVSNRQYQKCKYEYRSPCNWMCRTWKIEWVFLSNDQIVHRKLFNLWNLWCKWCGLSVNIQMREREFFFSLPPFKSNQTFFFHFWRAHSNIVIHLLFSLSISYILYTALYDMYNVVCAALWKWPLARSNAKIWDFFLNMKEWKSHGA